MSFSDKVVLVTGAGSGIGAATAIAFAKEGAKVVMVDKDVSRLKNIADKFEIGCLKPLTIHGDVSRENDVKDIIKKTINTCKTIDVLVNSAGIFNPSNIFHDNLMETYDEIMNVNLRGIVHITQLAVPHLVRSKGNIINISSAVVPSIPSGQNYLCYGMSKACLNYFSLDLAKELAVHGVRVNIISPGPVQTNVVAHLGRDDWWSEMKSQSPLGRISEAKEIADVIMFIAKAKGIHGSNYECDNGFKLVN